MNNHINPYMTFNFSNLIMLLIFNFSNLFSETFAIYPTRQTCNLSFSPSYVKIGSFIRINSKKEQKNAAENRFFRY